MTPNHRPDFPTQGLGHQFIGDFYQCTANLDDPAFIKNLALEAARLGKATVLEEITHQFSPHGLSCVLVIAESHLAIHTWPEHCYVAIDLFTCDLSVNGKAILAYFEAGLQSARSQLQRMERGVPLK